MIRIGANDYLALTLVRGLITVVGYEAELVFDIVGRYQAQLLRNLSVPAR